MTCELQRQFPGIEFRETKTGVEIVGFSDALLRQFSKRSRQIEAELGNLTSETAAAKAFACLKTRDPKQLVPPLAELLRAWQAEAQPLGFGPVQVAHLLRRRTPRLVNKVQVLDGAFSAAAARLTQRQSHFSELDLVRYTAQAAIGKGVRGREVVEFVGRQIQQSPDVQYIGTMRGRRRYSTPAVLAEEKLVVGTARGMAGAATHQVSFARLAARLSLGSVAATRDWLTLGRDASLRPEQRQVIEFLAQRSGQLAVLTARAGTAKHKTLARLGEFYLAAGYPVLVAAPSAGGARRLADQLDVPAMSVHALLEMADRDRSPVAGVKHAAKQLVREAAGRFIGLYPYQRRPLLTADTIIIVDRAERISTQDMGRLLARAKRAGSKVVLAGKIDGLQSIERGVPFASIARRVPKAELTEVVRPRGRRGARDVERVGRGEAKELLQQLAQSGRLHVADSQEAAIDKLLSDWRQAGGVQSPGDHLVVVGSAEQAKRVNDLASELCRTARAGAPDHKAPESVILPTGEGIVVGDRIVCTRYRRACGVQNGQLATVLAVSRRLNTIQVELDDAHRVTLPLATYPHVTRGYAQTVWHAGHAPHVYLLVGGGPEDRQSALTKFSRAAETRRLYVDRHSAGPELQELVRQFSADRKKTLAMEVQEPSPRPQQKR